MRPGSLVQITPSDRVFGGCVARVIHRHLFEHAEGELVAVALIENGAVVHIPASDLRPLSYISQLPPQEPDLDPNESTGFQYRGRTPHPTE